MTFLFGNKKGDKRPEMPDDERAELYADALEQIAGYFMVYRWAPLRFWQYPKMLRALGGLIDTMHNIANEALYKGGDVTVFSRDKEGHITGVQYDRMNLTKRDIRKAVKTLRQADGRHTQRQ